MAVFLLVQAPDIRQRQSVNEPGVKRRRLSFPTSGFLQCLLETHRIERSSIRRSSYNVLGLVLAKPGIAFNDVLAQCKRQELRVWQSYFRGSGDGFTIEIQERFMFKESFTIHTGLRHSECTEAKALDSRNFPLAPFFANRLKFADLASLTGSLFINDSTQSEQCTAATALARWPQPRFARPLAFPVLDPVVSLIARGAWTSIALHNTWPLPCKLFPGCAFPPEVSSAHVHAAKDVDSDDCDGVEFLDPPTDQQQDLIPAVLSCQTLDQAAEHVRALAQKLLPLVQDPKERKANLRLFQGVAGWMETVSSGLMGDGRHSHSTETLFHAVFFAVCLNSPKHAKKAVPLAAKLAIPSLDLEALSRQFPQEATLRRASTYLDLAFTMWAREFWSSEPAFHWAWADSSPQSGRDWLMLRHASCSQADILFLYRAVNMLVQGRPDFEDHFEARSLDLSSVAGLHSLLNDCLQDHACLPVAMGHAKTSVEDKAAAFLYSTAMESSSVDALGKHLSNFVSWTTDLGVEVGIPAFMSMDFRSLLPSFLQSPLETDVHDDVQEQPLPSVPALPAPAPAPLMPQVLIVPGALHLIHNLTSDLHKRLAYWPEFWQHLFNTTFLEGCDSEGRRSKLSDSESQSLESEFNQAKSYLHFGLVQKFDFWQKIPWKLCGLSHHYYLALCELVSKILLPAATCL